MISRETAQLLDQGIITTDKESDRRRYACKYLLTEKGRALAARIAEFSREVQCAVSTEIPPEELEAFYKTFGTLLKNFDNLTNKMGE